MTASLSPLVEEAIGREMADAKLLAARDLHTTRPKVLATLLDCSVDTRDGDASFESRLAALKEAMVTRPDRRTLVLCSSPSTVDRIVTALGETPSKNSVVRALHPEVAASERAATIAEFSADGEDASPTARASAAMVLVATDRAVRPPPSPAPPLSPPRVGTRSEHVPVPVKVRGLDLPRLEHLTLFDFPRDAVEYLRRVGMATRGARIGSA